MTQELENRLEKDYSFERDWTDTADSLIKGGSKSLVKMAFHPYGVTDMALDLKIKTPGLIGAIFLDNAKAAACTLGICYAINIALGYV